MQTSAGAIAASRALCRQTARQAGSNFYTCFLLLSRPKREAMEALYAFMRHSDDLGDNARPPAERREALASWRASLEAALGNQECCGRGNQSHDPFVQLLPALAETVRQFHIPVEHLFAVLDGVEMDLDGRRYATFEELAEYCHRVASAVGLACIHIWGFRGDAALEPARKCGLAFQLTNILRDLKEDAAQGRIYLPLADLEQCGYAAEEWLCTIADARFERLIQREIERTRRLYVEGAALFEFLTPEGRRIFGMMVSTYWHLLRKIEERPSRILEGRVRLGQWRKLGLAARWTLWPPRSLVLP